MSVGGGEVGEGVLIDVEGPEEMCRVKFAIVGIKRLYNHHAKGYV